jgi:hypothetical protein
MRDAWRVLAERQLGLISRAQAVDLGVSSSAIGRHVDRGIWRPDQPGVYAIAGAPRSAHQAQLAACLAVGGVASVSHRTAAAHWGLHLRDPGPLEISVNREHGPMLAGVTVHRSRDLVPDHVQLDGAVPVTGPARTLVDLGQVCPWYVVRDLLELLLSRKMMTIDHAHAALLVHSRRGRRGCGALRRVLEQRSLLDRPAGSVLEAAFADLCASSDLPRPEYQYPVTASGVERFVDFAYPELLLGIEVDGFETHATVAGFVSDRVRANDLVALGWTLLHFTWHQVIHQPSYVVRTIERALRRLAARPS